MEYPKNLKYPINILKIYIKLENFFWLKNEGGLIRVLLRKQKIFLDGGLSKGE